MLEDILKTTDPEKSAAPRYSLARICLFLSFLLIIIMSLMPLFGLLTPEDITNYERAMDTLIFLIMTFSLYAFGAKVTASINTNKNINK